VSFRFVGSGVSWLARRNPSSGPVQVYLDGLDQGVVTPDVSSGPFPAQQVTYSLTGLKPGPAHDQDRESDRGVAERRCVHRGTQPNDG
jgi:hypothetical protein